jgi:hypothetical protein
MWPRPLQHHGHPFPGPMYVMQQFLCRGESDSHVKGQGPSLWNTCLQGAYAAFCCFLLSLLPCMSSWPIGTAPNNSSAAHFPASERRAPMTSLGQSLVASLGQKDKKEGQDLHKGAAIVSDAALRHAVLCWAAGAPPCMFHLCPVIAAARLRRC